MGVRPGYKQTEVGVIPEDWEVYVLENVCKSICDGTHYTPRYVANGIPFYSVENITADDFENTKFISEEEHKKLIKRCKPERGDILMTRITAGVVGETRIINWDVNASIYVSLALLKPNDNIDPEYLYRYSRSTAFVSAVEKRALTNATPKKINMKDIGKIPIIAPENLSEQSAIATVLSDVDNLIESLDKLIAKKRDIKQAAMQSLLIGKIRLPEFCDKWEKKKFNELAFLRRNRIDPNHDDPHEFCIELENIEKGTGRLMGWSEPKNFSSLKTSFDIGDVLFGKLRAYLRKYWLATRPGVCSTEIWVLSPKPNHILSAYLYQLVTTNWFIDAAINAYGTHMPRSDWKVIKELEVLIPKIPEQSAIAEVLSDMDAEIETLEKKRSKTRLLKQGMMQEILTGKTRLI